MAESSKSVRDGDTVLRQPLGFWNVDGIASSLRAGTAAHQVVKFAKRNGVDCIIISSNRPGFPDHFMGSTALNVYARQRVLSRWFSKHLLKLDQKLGALQRASLPNINNI